MLYGDDKMRSISTYYFEAKGRDEKHYKAIVIIFAVSIMFPIATFTAFAYLAFFHSEWIANHTTRYVKGNYSPSQPSEGKVGSSSISKEINKTTDLELSLAEEGNHAFGDDELHVKNRKDNTGDDLSLLSNEATNIDCFEMSTCQTENIGVEEVTSCDAENRMNDLTSLESTQENEDEVQKEKEKEQMENDSKDGEKEQKRGNIKEVTDYWTRRVNVVALSITFVILSIALLVFHIIASIKLIHYGNEVLFDENDAHDDAAKFDGQFGKSNFRARPNSDYNLGNDDQCVPVVYTVFSFLPTVILFLGAVIKYFNLSAEFLFGNETFNRSCFGKCLHWLCYRHNLYSFDLQHYNIGADDDDDDDDGNKHMHTSDCNFLIKLLKESKSDELTKAAQHIAKQHDTDQTLGLLFKISSGIFFVYLGFYFLPYMALAFIHDPIQTGFVYLMAISFSFSIFTYIKAFFSVVAICKGLMPDLGLPKLFFVTASGFSVAYFLIIFLFILTLGNFHDFQAIENLTLPIIIALLSLFVFKPFIKYAKSQAKKDKLQLPT